MLDGEIFETNNIVYRSGDRIGNGASSVVFKAIYKLSGETVAAKVLKDHSKYYLQELKREVTALKQLSHPNIIRFYGVETELQSGRKVVILQYCEHSLHSFLQEPENRRGLPDEELMILFDNLCAAIKYLRNKEFIHRDVKPGNILRYITHDLRPVYVLSDFGTSRNLEDGEEYFSLVGTEEYLHPAVYEKVFVDRNLTTAFCSRTDLWSVGCTLYQAVSSQMPFQPYEGARNNRMIMYEMISCKPKRTISGHQHGASSEVKWEKCFPKGVKASLHLQDILGNIIADLLEVDPKSQLSFEELFKTQRELSFRFRLNMIQSSNGADFTLYVAPNTSLPELKEEIAKFTDIPAGDQTLYYDNVVLEKAVLKGARLQELFVREKPNYIVIDTKNPLFESLEPYKLDTFPLFSGSCDVPDDYQIAKTRRRIVNDIVSLVHRSYHFQQRTDQTLFLMWSMQKTFMLKQEKSLECLRLTVEECKSRVYQGIKNPSAGITEVCAGDVSFEKIDKKLGFITKMMESIQSTSMFHFKDLEQPKDLCDHLCLWKVDTYRDKMNAISYRIKRRKRDQTDTTEFQKYEHQKDRNEAEEVCASCLHLWQDHCWERKQKQYRRFIVSKRAFHECHNMSITARELLMEIRKDCDKFKRRAASKSTQVKDNFEDYIKAPYMKRKAATNMLVITHGKSTEIPTKSAIT